MTFSGQEKTDEAMEGHMPLYFPPRSSATTSDRARAGLLEDKGHLKQNRRIPRVPAQASVSQTPDTGEKCSQKQQSHRDDAVCMNNKRLLLLVTLACGLYCATKAT